MTAGVAGRASLLGLLLLCAGSAAAAQSFSQRGFIEAAVQGFPQTAANDSTRVVADVLAREDVFAKVAGWLQVAAGVDLRANSHDQVGSTWQLDLADRSVRRPALSLRRLSATVAHRGLTLDLGKQFIRWGKTDIVTPTDRFAPRDFVNVIATEFLPVAGLRGTWQHGSESVEGVWLPRATPSRIPLFDQRWSAAPAGVTLVDGGAIVPERAQYGARWSHAGAGLEYSASFFHGLNHLPALLTTVAGSGVPTVLLTRTYPSIRAYGADAAVPTRWVTVKAEAEYFQALDSDPVSGVASDDYLLYVVQVERQTGEWVLVGGYAGEVVTTRRSALTFAPDRGLTRALVGRASYTVDPRRGVAFEGALRQNGDGVFARAEYSETRGQHWRLTFTVVGVAGRDDDFLGQYHRNSHGIASIRYSF
jgi:hypothetical protein